MTPLMSLHLVSCVSMKLDRAARAEDLYISPWFRKARAYIRKLGAAWRILSAKHGLLDPRTEIEPYEQTLNKMAIAARRAWANAVLSALGQVDINEVVFLAGARYREFLAPGLEARGILVNVPLRGLGLGEQLRWFDEQLN